jgi:dienelactone hydrolase
MLRVLIAVMTSVGFAAHVKQYVDYVAHGVNSRGFVSYDDTVCTAQSKCPGVLIVQDWNGMNQYEMNRACSLASAGYVAFAADIYGTDIVNSWTGNGQFSDFIAASSAHRQNATLYMGNIMGAMAKMTSYDFVDSAKLAALGYCFGGTGVINLATSGHGGQYSVPSGVLGVVAYHAGDTGLIMPDRSAVSRPRLLIHHGVADESAFANATMGSLELHLENVSAHYEVQRYGSSVGHGFTEWDGSSYHADADRISWRSTLTFLSDLFNPPSNPSAPPAPVSPIQGSLVNYSASGANCTGYVIYNTSLCSSASKCPGVLVIQDWNGMNDYEKHRAHLLANMGFVAFAADIYGTDITSSWGGPGAFNDWAQASNMHRQDATLYMGKIVGALTVLSSYAFVDTSKLAAIGYCFGGTGAMNLAIVGHGGTYAVPSGLLGVVAYHAGSGGLLNPTQFTPSSRPKLALHQGRADTALPLSTVTQMEGDMEAVAASFEINWYGSNVGHGFTEWDGFSYHAIADARSWQATEAFLKDLFHGVTTGSPQPAQCSADSGTAMKTIVGTASADSRFTILVEALQTADLVGALSATGPFTVFAPTNAAFTALLNTLGVSKADLLARTDLANILKYHVITAAIKVMSSDLAATQDVTTLEGNKLTVTKNGSVVMAGNAKVSGADVECSNGVIHIIDAVLLPPSEPENAVSNSWCNCLSFSTVLLSGFLALPALSVGY